MNKLELLVLVLPIALCASCSTSASKYGSNKYITENGTTYVAKTTNGYLFSEIMLLANGTGSATRAYNSTYSTWNFHYIVDKDVELYFPWLNGDTIHVTFSTEDNVRYMTYISSVWAEFNASGYLNN